MEQNSTSNRLHALDGIRGLAIILVVLTHVATGYVAPLLPPWLGMILFSSGITGVSMLFILSGFFMAYIYPHPKNASEFIQKRYTRIFPLFLTMCAAMLLFRVSPQLPWYLKIASILIIATSAYFIWVHIIKKHASHTIKKTLFFSFVALQIVVGAFYVLWVMRHSAMLFNQQLPVVAREGTIGLVNATLTLPFGNYIPMLDGVYWSLVAEVFFYILYPFVCVPVVTFFTPFSKKIKMIGILSLGVLFAGADILSHKLFVLSMLQLPLCYYFIGGITLGYILRNRPEWIERLGKLFPKVLYLGSIIFFLFILGVKLIVIQNFSPYASWIHLLWAFPVTFCIAIALNHTTALSKFLSSRVLVYMGSISYSVYLTHTPVLHMVEDVYHVTNLTTNSIAIFITFFATITLSSVLYLLLEKPYLLRNKQKETVHTPSSAFYRFVTRPGVALGGIVIVYVVAVFAAYQSNFNFFSVQRPYSNTVFIAPHVSATQTAISMKQYPRVQMRIHVTDSNFEVITMHITHKAVLHAQYKTQKLVFRIKEHGQGAWYATNTYLLALINDSRNHPFGFPIIENSKGKTYDVELALSDPSSSEYIVLDTSPGATRGVYKVDKYQLLKHPLDLASFTAAHMVAVIENKDATVTLLLGMPFAALVVFLLAKQKTFRR